MTKLAAAGISLINALGIGIGFWAGMFLSTGSFCTGYSIIVFCLGLAALYGWHEYRVKSTGGLKVKAKTWAVSLRLIILPFQALLTLLLVLLLGAGGGLAAMFIVVISEDIARNRKRFGMVLLVVIPFLLAGLAAGTALHKIYFFTNRDFSNLSYQEALDQMMAGVSRSYPFFEALEIDPEALKAEYSSRALLVENDKDFARLTAQYLNAIGDLHGAVYNSPMAKEYEAYPGFYARLDQGGNLLITAIDRSTIAADAGLDVGDRVARIDGLTPREIIAELPGYLYQGPSVTTAAYMRDSLLLRGIAGSRMSLEVIKGNDADPYVVPVTRSHPYRAWRSPDYFEILEGDIRYFRIPTFNQQADPVGAFAELFDRLGAGGGWIFDLRGNPGGDSRIADSLFRYLFSEKITHLSFCWNHPFSLHIPMFVRPGEVIYPGPLVLLIDESTASTAEYVAQVLTDHRPNTYAVGRPTNGARGNPSLFFEVNWKMPGGVWTRHSVGYVTDAGGRLLHEGEGVIPDVLIPAHLGPAVELDAAVRVLLGGTRDQGV